MRLGIVDTNNPVSDHPLNRGLVSWWLPLPNNAGGSRLFDLKGGNHGTLTNGPTWAPSGLGDGFGRVNFDGSDDQINLSSTVNLTGDFTLCATVNATVFAGSHRTIMRRDSGAGGASGYWLWRVNSSSQMEYSANLSTVTSTPTLTAGRTYRLVTTRSGTVVTHYVDGATFHSGTNSATPTSTDTLYFGRFGTGFEPWSGWQTDYRIYTGRALSAGEVGLLYEQSLRGHPDTLRRFNRRSYFYPAQAPAVPGVFNPGWTTPNRVIRGF